MYLYKSVTATKITHAACCGYAVQKHRFNHRFAASCKSLQTQEPLSVLQKFAHEIHNCCFSATGDEKKENSAEAHAKAGFRPPGGYPLQHLHYYRCRSCCTDQ